MKPIVITLILVSLLVLAIGFSAYVWVMLGDVQISIYGFLAMAGGALVSIALGSGLMWLMFKSNRDGFDQ